MTNPGFDSDADRSNSVDRVLMGTIGLFALAAPWSIAGAQIAFVLTALILVFERIRGRIHTPPLPWTLLAVLAFLLAQAASIPGSVHPARSLRCFDGSWVLLFPFVFWPVLHRARIRRVGLFTLIISGGLAGVYGCVQHLQGIDWLHQAKTLENYGGGGYVSVGNLSSHLTYAGVLLPIFFLALGWTLDRGLPRRRWAGISALAIGLALIASFTRSAWIGLAAGILIFGFWRGRRMAITFTVGLFATAAVAYVSQPALARRLASILDIQETPRWKLWQAALSIIADHPWNGAGLGSFKTQFPIYKIPGEYMSTIHPHSDLLNHMVEAGIWGGLAWIAIWVAFLLETRGTSRSAKVDGLRAGVVALLVAGVAQCYSTDEEVAQVWMFLFVAGLIEAGRITEGGRRPLRQLNRIFKRASLPVIARIYRPSPTSLTSARSGALPERILVVRQDNRLGNLVLMTPFLQNLRRSFPQAHIAMVTGEAFAPLLARWPWVDEWIVQPKRRHAQRPWEFRAWVAELGAGTWDVAFEMSNYNTHSYFNCVLTLASRAPVRIGFDEPRNQNSLTESMDAPKKTDPFSLVPLALLESLGVTPTAEPLQVPIARAASPAFQSWRSECMGAEQPYYLIHLGGRGKKSLSPNVWKKILGGIAAGTDRTIVLVLGPDERGRLGETLVDDTNQTLVAPALDLFDLSLLIEGAEAYLGGDTGVMHLAAALGTPTVALFFQSNPYHYAPLGSAHTTIVLANPYGVRTGAWREPLPWSGKGLTRSRLVLLPDLPIAEQDPRTDEVAISAIVEATLASNRTTVSSTSGEETDTTSKEPTV